VTLISNFVIVLSQSDLRAEMQHYVSSRGVIALGIGSMLACRFYLNNVIKLFPLSDELDEETVEVVDRLLEQGVTAEVIANALEKPVEFIEARIDK
jgi:hypothetical protein